MHDPSKWLPTTIAKASGLVANKAPVFFSGRLAAQKPLPYIAGKPAPGVSA
jgi:hypothetical protein